MLDHEICRESKPPSMASCPEPVIRSYRSSDRLDVLRLFREGLLAGSFDPNDSAPDLQDILAAYFQRPQDHFWVAENDHIVIATISVFEDKARVAHIRRLRIAPNWQRDNCVATRLIRTAIDHARSHGCLKLVFHTSLDSAAALELLSCLGLQFARTRDEGGRHVLEFYDNLYATIDSIYRASSEM